MSPDVNRDETVFECFLALCDRDPNEVDEHLQGRAEAFQRQVRAMLAADRVETPLLSEEAIADGVAAVMADDMTGSVPMEWVVPSDLPGVRLGEELGRGGMGVVIAGTQLTPRREVAVKFLGSEVAENAEAHMLARLRHPSIPVVFEVGDRGGIAYLIMERVYGEPLLQWCSRATADEVLRLFSRVGDAVQYAHEEGVLHRDIKPSNLLVANDSPWVLDFGLAHIETGDQRGAVGTLPYVSDECLAGAPASRASDVFSLGVMLAEMLGMERPTARATTLHHHRRLRTQSPPHLKRLHPRDELDAILRSCLAPLGQRYPSVQALVADVQAVLERRPPRAFPGSWRYRTKLFSRRHRNGVVATCLLGVTVCVLASFPLLEARDRWTSEALAEEMAGEVRKQMMVKFEAGDPDGGIDVVERALRGSALAGTRSAAGLEYELGEELLEAGREEAALRWFTRAHLDARDPVLAQRAALRLAEPLNRRHDWAGLVALLPLLPETDRARYAKVVALGRRDLSNPAVGAPWEFLRHAHRLPYRPVELALAGDRLQLYESDERRVVELSTTGVWRRSFTFDGPWAGVTPRRSAVLDGSIWWTARGPGEDLSVLNWGEDWSRLQTPARGADILSAAFADLDGDPSLFVGTGPPSRRLIALDMRTGMFSAPVPERDALRSDINQLVPGDFDGDGAEDLLVFQGAWRAYDLERLSGGLSQGVRRTDRLRLGGTVVGTRLDRPGPPWVALWKADQYPEPTLFPGVGFGSDPGLYLLSLQEQGWRVEGYVPGRSRTWTPRHVVAGDFDGDGWDDVAVSLGHRAGLVVRLGPEGVVEHQRIGAMVPLAASDVDGDGSDELFARLEDDGQHLWILGWGKETPPVMEIGPTDTYDGLPERVRTLARLGQPLEALEVLTARAEGAADPAEARSRWESVAEFASLPEVVRPDLAEAALRRAQALGAPPSTLQSHLAMRHYLAGELPWQVDLHQPTFTVHRPSLVEGTKDGLRLEGVGDGVVLSRAVRHTGTHLAIELGLVLHQMDAGSAFRVALVDAQGRDRLVAQILSRGSGETVHHSAGCTTPGTLEEDGKGPHPPEAHHERIVLRASSLDGRLLCRSARDTIREVSRAEADHDAGDPVRVEIRFDSFHGYRAQFAALTLATLQLTGVEPLPVQVGPEASWVWGSRQSAVDDLGDSPFAPLLHVELGDLDAARRTLAQLPEQWLTSALRRDPLPWMSLLAHDPRLQRFYSDAWTHPSRFGGPETRRRALEHPIDGFSVDTHTRPLLYGRALSLAEAGQEERAQGLFRALLEDQEDPLTRLELAASLLRTGKPVEALEACERALGHSDRRQLVRDLLSMREELWKACGKPALTAQLSR